MRLDVAVTKAYTQISRNQAARLIEQGKVKVNNVIQTKASFACQPLDEIEAEIVQEQEYQLIPCEMELDIIYEDDSIAIINKPRGMVVHPGAGNLEQTLVHGLIGRFEKLSDLGGEFRPGIVHRIDKDTSGILVIAKNNEAHLNLKNQLEQRTMDRVYLAVCKGGFSKEEFVIEKPIGRHPVQRKKMAVVDEGKFASTEFRVLDSNLDFSLVECELFTGRTHQIRVHLMYAGHPIVGDTIYGKQCKVNFDGQALHSFKIGLDHPVTNKRMVFEAQPPADMIDLCRKCKLRLVSVEEEF